MEAAILCAACGVLFCASSGGSWDVKSNRGMDVQGWKDGLQASLVAVLVRPHLYGHECCCVSIFCIGPLQLRTGAAGGLYLITYTRILLKHLGWLLECTLCLLQ